MKTSNQIVCVLRAVGGVHQWVAASGRQDLVNNEATMVGYFDSFELKSGPSGSHVTTCYEPLRGAKKSTLDITEFQAPSKASCEVGTQKSCVLRLVGDHHEHVDAYGRFDLVTGETLVSGKAVRSTIKTGPSGSHAVTVWTFVGATQRSVVPQNDETGRYALAELLQGDPRKILIIDRSQGPVQDMSHLLARPADYVGATAR
jgi:hypothetical protein